MSLALKLLSLAVQGNKLNKVTSKSEAAICLPRNYLQSATVWCHIIDRTHCSAVCWCHYMIDSYHTILWLQWLFKNDVICLFVSI